VGSAAGKTEKDSSEICAKLGRKGLVVVGAVAVQANRIWLVSGATVTLNFSKNQCTELDLPLRLEKNAVKRLP
jgi:hypothetical protein